jgi:Rrf2 family transcriptional regulator, iron-sulfur cluster assembly transcription factor
VNVLIDLVLHQDNGPVVLLELSLRVGFSVSYLENIFADLRHHGIVKGVRGPGGGYSLARAADEVTVADIVRAVDRPQSAKPGGAMDMMHDLSTVLKEMTMNYLGSVSVKDLVDGARACGARRCGTHGIEKQQ